MAKYVKLGPKAESFNSPNDHLSLVRGAVKVLPNKYTKTVQDALQGGHLVPASEFEYNVANKITPVVEKAKSKTKAEKAAEKAAKLADLKEKLVALDDNGLVDYYTDTYQVEDKDVEKLNKLSTEEKVAYLLSLEE